MNILVASRIVRESVSAVFLGEIKDSCDLGGEESWGYLYPIYDK